VLFRSVEAPAGTKSLRYTLEGVNCKFDGQTQRTWDAPATTRAFTVPKWFAGAEAKLYVSASSDGTNWGSPAIVAIRFGGNG
jgi:hypothetical protein